jgi:DNA invertase Pin-like site-specific DNA recombinase
MAQLGYARVSTHQQSLDLQVKRLSREGVREDRLFTDKASGKNTDERAGLQRLIARAESGDEILITKMDRLGRNTVDMVSLVESFSARGVVVRFLDDHLTTDGETGKLIITILAAVAQAERARILERTNEGRVAALERGVRFGRPATVDTKRLQELLDQNVSKTEIAKELGVTRQYIYKLLNKLNDDKRTER